MNQTYSMGNKMTFKGLLSKAASRIAEFFIPLNTTDSGLIKILGNDYKFGTQSKDFLLKAYGMNPYVFMVIDRIVQRLVQIDKMLLNDKGQEIEDLNFSNLLQNLNAKENFDILLYRVGATYLAAGEVFIVRDQALGENDKYFVPVNYNVIINQDTKGEIISYWITHYGNAKAYLPGEVLHLFKPDITLDTNHGFSTLRATRKVWESNNEVWASEAALHKNKGVAGVLYSDGNRPMTPGEEKQLQAKYDSDNTGYSNFGKVKVSSAKLGYIQMGMNPNDLKSIESRLDHLRTVCASFNVDSKLFGDSAASTFNNYAEAQRGMVINAVIPLSKILLPALAKFFSRSIFKTYSLKLDSDTITELNLSKEQQSARLGREVIQGILTAEQARQILYPELVEEVEEVEGDTMEENSIVQQQNAEAQANLRGSVGGVQGLIQIQQSIVAGVTSRESAIVMLIQIYGFDEDTANDILG